MLGLVIYFGTVFCLHGFLLLIVSFIKRLNEFHALLLLLKKNIFLFLLISKIYYPGDHRRNVFLLGIMFSINWHEYFVFAYISLLRRRGNCDNASESLQNTLLINALCYITLPT